MLFRPVSRTRGRLVAGLGRAGAGGTRNSRHSPASRGCPVSRLPPLRGGAEGRGAAAAQEREPGGRGCAGSGAGGGAERSAALAAAPASPVRSASVSTAALPPPPSPPYREESRLPSPFSSVPPGLQPVPSIAQPGVGAGTYFPHPLSELGGLASRSAQESRSSGPGKVSPFALNYSTAAPGARLCLLPRLPAWPGP